MRSRGTPGSTPPRPARAFTLDDEPRRGILYPNATCPECRERVWFFEARNGGRVLFDSLWPDWDKHPCTIRDDAHLLRPTAVDGEPDEDGIEAYPRPRGTILRVDGEWVRGDLDCRARYFRNAHAVRDGSGRITSICLVRDDLTRVTIPVEPCAAPTPMTDKARRAVSTRMKEDAIRVSRRIPGRANRTLVTDAATGSFVIGTLEETRVVIIPVPTDQHLDERDPWGTGSSMYEVLGRYMVGTAEAALAYAERKVRLPDDLLHRHRAVFVFHDPFGYHSTYLELSYRSFFSEDGKLDLREFDHVCTLPLPGSGLAEACWTDATDDGPIVLRPIDAEDESVLAREDAFCRANWPYGITGQWNQILALGGRLGVLPLIEAVNKLLISAGWGIAFVRWRPEGDRTTRPGDQREKLEYTAPAGCAAAKVSSVRVLFHRSSTEEGLVMLVDPDSLSGYAVEGRVARITSFAEGVAFARHLEDGWFRQGKAA